MLRISVKTALYISSFRGRLRKRILIQHAVFDNATITRELMKANQEFLHTPLTIPARKTADATNLKAELRRDIIPINSVDAH